MISLNFAIAFFLMASKKTKEVVILRPHPTRCLCHLSFTFKSHIAWRKTFEKEEDDEEEEEKKHIWRYIYTIVNTVGSIISCTNAFVCMCRSQSLCQHITITWNHAHQLIIHYTFLTKTTTAHVLWLKKKWWTNCTILVFFNKFVCWDHWN